MQRKRKKYNFSAKDILILITSIVIVAVIVLILCKTGLSVDVSNHSDNDFTEYGTSAVNKTEVIKPEPHVESVTHDNIKVPVNDIIPMSAMLSDVPETAIEKDGLFDTVTFAAAGDILIHTNVYKYAAQLAANTSAEYDFKPIFKNIKEIISSADLAYVNQETPSAGKDRVHSGYPRFNTPDEIADAVIDCGFDIVNVANNHMLDMGASGLERNINFWSSKDVTLIGGFKNKQDYNNIRVIEKNNISIALLSYTYGTNGLVLPASSELYVPYEDYDEINRQTKLAREMADVVIVSMHWGHEDHFNPSDNQKKLARMMADNGVDVVLGMHPHVLQPIEWLERPDGGKTLVIYSLGNIISTMMYSRNMLGGIATFTIVKSPAGITIEMPELIPTMTYYQSGFASPTIYLYKNFDDTMLSRHGASKYDSLISRKYLNNIITGCIDRQFITDEFYDSIYGE